MRHPSDDTRKIMITLPADVVDAFRSKLQGGETVRDAIRRFVIETAKGRALS